MGFTKTDEGRVFFQNADNDDKDPKRKAISAANQSQVKKKNGTEALLPKDNTSMQILMLLKSLNSKLTTSKEENEKLKKSVALYRNKIKTLEETTKEQQDNYIDLEKKLSRKQAETNKKTSRVEENVKTQVETTLKQIEEAKDIVKELEQRNESYDTSLLSLKEQLKEQKKRDLTIVKQQKEIAETQKKHDEKMVSSVATYIDLTKRVSENETRQETLENKIEESRSDYLKLDRKIDKAIEDRNRILRKVERIEQAVLETRDALNAKAMVLLTDQGAVAGIDMPQITDDMAQTDPMLLRQRLEEEALLPWWRRPVRLQSTSLALLAIIAVLFGWIISASQTETPIIQAQPEQPPTKVSLATPPQQNTAQAPAQNTYAREEHYAQAIEQTSTQTQAPAEDVIIEDMGYEPPAATAAKDDYGITIHKGFNDPNSVKNKTQTINVYDESRMEKAMEENPDALAERLNQIEPSNLTSGDLNEPAKESPLPYFARDAAEPETQTKQDIAATQHAISNDLAQYRARLRTKIQPDPQLTDITKKIESQAFDGVPEAQHDMGAIYVSGHGQIKADLDRAVFWFTEAANNGIANAKYNLGVLYHQGIGVEPNIARAIELYKQAADIGHPEAQYNLGIAYIEGIGVAYTPYRAAYYFEKAASTGIIEAAYNLGLIYENGLLGETQPDKALMWYKRAADEGSQEASSALEQLAVSLGIERQDIDRIVENVSEENNTAQKLSQATESKETVANIQKELMNKGLYPGPVDGMIGPNTKSAIEKFQSMAGLHVTGEPSENLLSYLRAANHSIYQ